MAEFSSPSEIARETLRRLASKRLQPTPENFVLVYNEINGTPTDDEPFPERHLRKIAASLPRATPEQLKLARQFETAIAERNWQVFRQQLVAMMSAQTEDSAGWAPLIKDLLAQLERRQLGLSDVTKREALDHVLDGNAGDAAVLNTRLKNLIKGWSQLPASSGNEPDPGPPSPAQTPIIKGLSTESSGIPVTVGFSVARPSDLDQAPETWREILATTLENAVNMLLIDTPELSDEAVAIGHILRNPLESSEEDFEARLKKFAYKVQWVAQDQSYIRQALLNLLQLIIENISELVVEDKWLRGQMGVLLDLFHRPLDKHVLEEMSERLRDVILKQGSLKRSLSEAQDRLREMLAHFIDRLGLLSETTGTYHGKITVFAERVSKASSLEELAGLVGDIMTETETIEKQTRSSQEELITLRSAVDQAHQEISRLEVELEHASAMVRHDPLTGSLNRKGLEEMLQREVSRAIRRSSRLCIAMLDVDNFKKLNDTFGHITGDEALKHLAAVIRENIRPQDSSGRWGGEEFLLLLPETTLDDGAATMRRLQRELTKRFFLHDNQKILITFSAGVAELQAGEDPQRAIDRADKAMYEAKRSGKNRVEIG